MAISTQIQNLNLIPGKSAPVVVHLSQGNVGNTVQFYLYDGDDPYYPTNVSIAVHGVRADNTVFGPYAVSVTSGSNLVSFDIVAAMTSVNGAAIGELVLTDGNQNQVGSANFGMLVEETPYSSSVTYEDDLSIYQRILAYVQSIPADLQSEITDLSNDVTAERNARIASDNSITSEVNALKTAFGSPLVASTKSGMTDKTKIYVYTGSESGMTNGNWYYWNGSAWTSGGVYNSTAFTTDTTLSIYNNVADANATGAAVNILNESNKIIYSNYYRNIVQASETASFPSAEANGRDKYIMIENISSAAGFYTFIVYDTGDNVVYDTTSASVMLNAGDKLVVNVGKVEAAKVLVNNINWRAFSLHVYEARDLIDSEAIRNGVNTVYYKNLTSLQGTTEDIKIGTIPADGRHRYVTLTNTSATGTNAAFFSFTVYDSSNSVVYSITQSTLLYGGDFIFVDIGDVEVSRMVVNNPNQKLFSVKVHEIINRPIINVGPTRTIKKFTDALDAAMKIGETDIYVDAGVYDIVQELGETKMKSLNYGPKIGYGIKIYFSSDSIVRCYYTGTDSDIQTKFSPLNSQKSEVPHAADYEINGGFIDCKNVRYCIHDELDGKGTYTHKYNNCRMRLNNVDTELTVNAAIGGGFGQYGTILVNGGEYECVGMELDSTRGLDGVIRYHQPTAENQSVFKNNLICKNVYCVTGTIVAALVGDYADELSELFVTGCSCLKAPYINGEDNQYIAQNFRKIVWNNEVRS